MERGEQQQNQENSRSSRAVVTAITDQEAKNGKQYKVVELSNGSKLRIFDKKKLAGIGIGLEVDYSEMRNDNGFWNVTSLAPSPEAQLFTPTPEATPKIEPPSPRPMRESLGRTSEMRVMNALTASATIVSALIAKDLLKPVNLNEAFDAVSTMHGWMMKIDQPKGPPVAS